MKIRYLASMLSAYDLLNDDGPCHGIASNGDQVRLLQNRSLEIGQSLRIGYQTNLGIPDNGINLQTRSTHGDSTSGIAAGALQLEFARLADMWNDPT